MLTFFKKVSLVEKYTGIRNIKWSVWQEFKVKHRQWFNPVTAYEQLFIITGRHRFSSHCSVFSSYGNRVSWGTKDLKSLIEEILIIQREKQLQIYSSYRIIETSRSSWFVFEMSVPSTFFKRHIGENTF